ncbi:hypothetical protein CDD81_3928 [Ophiocordyceps australis]|uniref:Fanconi-associated nuclease n=1 Tax=Ophiocordyceps australis TaxID=1399860 RepID=A0A2C5XUA7_9HYPO|nr:hypothetical protein CDD81_3928 [Ophiocordyceps australis]
MDAFVKRIPQGERVFSEARATRSGPTPEPPPAKRCRREEATDSASETGEEHLLEQRDPDDCQDEAEEEQRGRTTDVENVLAPTQVDDDAIKEYEDMRSLQLETRVNETDGATWVPAKSSIYVDAFNLALDTVLEDEWQLFNDEELQVFGQWRSLDYQSQYLYVRLFLRKTAAWHRSSRLKYYADVSDPEAAIESLQQERPITQSERPKTPDEIAELGLQDVSIGQSFSFVNVLQVDAQTINEALPLLLLDELKMLAKEAKTRGGSKTELIKGLVATSQQQVGLRALGLGRCDRLGGEGTDWGQDAKLGGQKSQEQHVVQRTRGLVGPCIRVSPLSLKLFERVHLVFYRSTEWSEKSLLAIILARMSKRTFADYVVCRSSTIFASRMHLVEYEEAIRLEARIDSLLESNGKPSEADYQEILDTHDRVYPRWQALVAHEGEKEQRLYETGQGAYLRRFNPAHSYTRIMHKALAVLARRKQHGREHALLGELLAQRLFHPARRGAWYQRKALVEEHYMYKASGSPHDAQQHRRAWRRVAAATCEAGLQDPDCHLVHHYDLQKRLVKLEKQLRIPRRLQHDFGHVQLAQPVEMTISGIQVKRRGGAASTKTIWLDSDAAECSVEQMCLGRLRAAGWKGYHSEGGILRTLFAYLFYDVLFCPLPNVFQTPFQTCPLDLFTDAFFPARISRINHLLAQIANGAAEHLLRSVWARHHAPRTSIVGLRWEYGVQDLAELVRCLGGPALAAVCTVLAQDYRQRAGGVPDLLLWREKGAADEQERQVLFVEVKSANDRLSDSQRLWIHVLTGAGIKVALCNAVASEVRHL